MADLQKKQDSALVRMLTENKTLLLGCFIALILISPTLVITSYIFSPSDTVFSHLVETVLWTYVSNSLLLMIGVGFGSLLLGVSAAWFVSMCDFPLKRLFEWALLLPIAMPAYIIAYTYTGLLDFAGPVQTAIREMTGLGYGAYYFPEIRSLGGAIIMLSLVLYPYIYMTARASFLSQSICVLDVSRSLGHTMYSSFWRIALPLARPAIFVGLALVLMETLADYGTVQYFGVDTFTTGIFRTWYGLDSLSAAAQLATLLLLFILILFWVETKSRKGAQYHATSQRHQDLGPIKLRGVKASLALLICSCPLVFGFIIPACQLLYWAIFQADVSYDAAFWRLAWNSLQLGMLAALACILLSLYFGYINRHNKNRLSKLIVKLSTMGYAVPGTVIAVGVMVTFTTVENSFDRFMRDTFDISTGLIFSGTIFALVFAYTVRFMAAGFGSIESGLIRIKTSLDEAATSLGHRSPAILTKVHLPMMKGSILTAGLIVFVDVMKELPATLILRPFNFNTLAVRAYELASDEKLAQAAPAALMIVATGIIPVILLSRAISKTRKVKDND
ncbi:iron ABC transporter permease [Temperatibacter marinus]|uniref:Iron ABC transporter permease n=1 Tax=Temperatibacter marinus TaxID=1456591 RepID=A0AA52EBS4_9PROT|nr:iron ABC transporter permease [Temperatibacter marinus]WND01815.1 iron ABC transporter permease [Temperatibacter marinus]